MDIFVETKKLNFPAGEYIVVGSGIMDALEIKNSHDVDIVVTGPLFENCRSAGWEVVPWTYPGKTGQVFLRRGYVELFLNVNEGKYNPTTKELIDEAVIINEVPFISLERRKAFKRAYGREKHLKDIALIEAYLSK